MSERYQIKAKIGQGGIGAVYRAFDTHLQREVAVKRLLPADESEAFDDDPTKSLFKEAHLLSALQHPNVVSVYDVGTDSDGVFVVMELVDGETFDQVVDRGLLTEDDFTEMVSQTLEALIAAQDKALVHRDIKPTNLMVKWLPSGKFQFKLLDFGLAKFSPKPSQQTIGLNDAILGSIHFMAPEQFERLPLDGRTDLYAIGCMYYYGLTGRYPFDGDTAAEVMAAHLSHRLTPMEEIRPDISKRINNWVMWLMSREMGSRPSSAQEALEYFFNPDAEIPGSHSAPRLILPHNTPQPGMPRPAGAIAAGVKPAAAYAKPASTPVKLGTGPIRPASGPVRLGSSPVRLGTGSVRPGVRPGTTGVTPSAGGVRPGTGGVRPGTGGVRPVSGQVPQHAVPAPVAEEEAHAQTVYPQAHHYHPPKEKKSPVLKWSIISIVSAALIIGGGMLAFGSGASVKKEYKKVAEFVNSDQVNGTAADVNLIAPYLNPPSIVPTGQRDDLIQRVKDKLESLDGPGVEPAIIEQLSKSRGTVQNKLIHVVVARKMRDAMGPLTRIALEAGDEESAKYAIQAISVLGDVRDAETVMDVMSRTKSTALRGAAESAMQVFIDKATTKTDIVPMLEKGLNSQNSKEVQQASLRLLGQTGTTTAAKSIEGVLSSGDADLKLAAITALRDWPNDSQLDRLSEIGSTGTTEMVKTEAFNAFVKALSLHLDRTRAEAKHRSWWSKAEMLATTPPRKQQLLTGLSMVAQPFAIEIVTKYQSDSDPGIRVMATEAKKQIEQAIKEKPKT